MKVILSTPLLLEEGSFSMKTLTLDEAKRWVDENQPVNFCGHATTLAVGLQPCKSRDVCTGYEQALVLKPIGRIDFGKEYTYSEIMEIGVTPFLITKQS